MLASSAADLDARYARCPACVARDRAHVRHLIMLQERAAEECLVCAWDRRNEHAMGEWKW